jgi:hypothetical protein
MPPITNAAAFTIGGNDADHKGSDYTRSISVLPDVREAKRPHSTSKDVSLSPIAAGLPGTAISEYDPVDDASVGAV